MVSASSKSALVTGASSGIGLAVTYALIREGWHVYGIARNFTRPDCLRISSAFPEGSFTKLCLDLRDTDALIRTVKKISRESDISLLVNNAGAAYYGLHEELSPEKISEMVRTNLEAPMILSQLLLRDFKKKGGCIVNISSVTASSVNPHGCAYGATKAGLTGFAASLFAEVRKSGVRVITISPDMTDTQLYRNADFGTDPDRDAYLDAEDVAEAVLYSLRQPPHVDICELTLRPQKHKIARKKSVSGL